MEEEEGKTEDCLSLWSGEDCQPLPFCKLKIICVQQQIIHFTSQPFVSFLQCMYTGMHNTIGLTCACNHVNGEWGKRVYTFHVGHPWVLNGTVNAWMCHSNAKCIFNSISIHILCLVYTVQPLDNFITSVVLVQGLYFQFSYGQFLDLENTFGLVQLQFAGFA